jgi:hypothetical protein
MDCLTEWWEKKLAYYVYPEGAVAERGERHITICVEEAAAVVRHRISGVWGELSVFWNSGGELAEEKFSYGDKSAVEEITREARRAWRHLLEVFPPEVAREVLAKWLEPLPEDVRSRVLASL